MAVLTRIERAGARRREIALALAALVLAATAPAFFAPTVRDSVPALTLDICHPLQSIDSPRAITLARPAAVWTVFAPAICMRMRRINRQLATRPGDAPDTPPPKAAV